ncbi:hypothetical protein [Candidatus Harpocratesius sp.]
MVSQTGIVKIFKPRLYSSLDFIVVMLNAIVAKQSTTYASEFLNNYFVRHDCKRKFLKINEFIDGIRKRRLVPHQADVDKFFRLLSEIGIHFIFGNLLNRVNREIRSKENKGSKMRLLVDSTEYPYYGMLQPSFELGTQKQPRTCKVRLFQGFVLQCCGLTLFSEFRLLRYG